MYGLQRVVRTSGEALQDWVLTIDWLEQGSEEIELSLKIPGRGEKRYVTGRRGRYVHGCTFKDREERSGIKWDSVGENTV